MTLHIDERTDGNFALFIDGDLQFDTADEALYHEGLTLPALCMAGSCARVLICGGGDGLALRECLRFPGVERVDLVDYSPEVVELGRTRFAGINRGAFEDHRVAVHIADAWEQLDTLGNFDVVLCDFTVPRKPDDARVFTREWYSRISASLNPNGIVAVNAVSPQATPEAFWCLRKSIRAAGLNALAYRVCIPSFRAQGYGAWTFMLAARRPLRLADLKQLECPVETRQLDLARLYRGASFTRAESSIERHVPVNSLENLCLVPLLLNPAMDDGRWTMGGGRWTIDDRRWATDYSRNSTSGRAGSLSSIVHRPSSADPSSTVFRPSSAHPSSESPFDLAPLLNAIPVTHPYHTREMVEAMAEQVIGAIRSLDIKRLVNALLRRAGELPKDLVRELRKLRDFLRDHTPSFDAWREWSYRLFAALVITMTLANTIAPDNAFAKGAHGLGHASMSRGYSGGFGGGRGEGGSFSSARSGGFGGTSFSRSGGFGGPAPRITSSGFRSRYSRGGPVDVYGYSYAPRYYIYCGGGYYHVHPAYQVSGGQPAARPEKHQALFVADDDMMVLDSGDVVITLSDGAYLLVTGGTVALFNEKNPEPILPVYPDPGLFRNIQDQVQSQQAAVQHDSALRRDWLGWVGWTSALFPIVAEDKREVRNLDDMTRKLDAAARRIGSAPANAVPASPVTAGQVELFVGGYLLSDDTIGIRQPDSWLYTDGRSIWTDKEEKSKSRPCPPLLTEAVQSILKKLQKELTADVASDKNDLRELYTDNLQLQQDLVQYQGIYMSSGYQSDYEVDYGTDSISVSQAISRTQADIQQNQIDYQQTQLSHDKAHIDLDRINSALHGLWR